MRNKISLVIILTITIALFSYVGLNLFEPGYIYFTDVTEGLSVNNLFQRYIFTYSNDMGEALAEKARIPLFFGIYEIFKLTRLDDSFYVKIKLLTLIMSTFIIFAAVIRKFIYTLQNEDEGGDNKNQITILISSLFGALYYIVNYWASNRLLHFYLFFASATIPVTFYLIYIYLFSKNDSFRHLLILASILSLITATPHTILFEILIILTLYIIFAANKPFIRKEKVNKTIGLLIFGLMYVVLNLYWILPFLFSHSSPDAILSETIVKLLGKEATVLNTLKLQGYWLAKQGDYYSFSSPVIFIQKLLAYIPFIITLITIYLYRKGKYMSQILSLFLILGIFLASSNAISNFFYFQLMFSSPLKTIGWVFREFDKFGIILSFVYALSISLFVHKLIHQRKRILKIISFVIVISALISNSIYLFKTLSNNFEPQKIPDDFAKVISLLEKDPENSNTVWYPGVEKPVWSKTGEVRFVFSNLISPKPTITTQSNILNYLSYLFEERNFYAVNMGRALDLIGVKYLIIRKDGDLFPTTDFDGYISYQKSMKKIFSTKYLVVYVNNEFSGISKIYRNRIVTNKGLDILRNLNTMGINTSDTFIDFTDKPSRISEGAINTQYAFKTPLYIDQAINKYLDKFIYPWDYATKKDDGNPGYWKLASLEDLKHAEDKFYLNHLGLTINQFDYNKGVVNAYDGWQRIHSFKTPKKYYDIAFTHAENIKKNKNKIEYKATESDFKYYWNVQRSDKFDIQGISAINIKLKSDIDKGLVPHFKIYTYDENLKNTGISFIFGDERNNIDTIIKIPEGSKYADFSVWTLSTKNRLYYYKLENFSIADVSNNVGYSKIEFTANTQCVTDCTVLIRLLKSAVSGTLTLGIDSGDFNIDTKTTETSEINHTERYDWVIAGHADTLNKKSRFKLINTSGFNSVNAIVILNQQEYENLKHDIEKIQIYANNPRVATEAPSLTSTQQINPTLYAINLQPEIENKMILALAKPYSINWTLVSKPKQFNLFTKSHEIDTPHVINGYITGWEIETADSRTYYVEYKLQKYFYMGSIISGITFISILVYLMSARVVIASTPKSKSQG